MYIAAVFFSQQVFADSTILSQNNYGEGDYFVTDVNGESLSDFAPSGVDFYGGNFAVPNSSQGAASGLLGGIPYVFSGDHNFVGSGFSSAYVSDPDNQLAVIQTDAETTFSFRFSIATPHTYTLTGDLTSDGISLGNELGRVSLLFDTIASSEQDAGFDLSGTLAAGEYSFSVNSIAALDNAGFAAAAYQFDLQIEEVASVPMPADIGLFGVGLIGLVSAVRRRRNPRYHRGVLRKTDSSGSC